MNTKTSSTILLVGIIILSFTTSSCDLFFHHTYMGPYYISNYNMAFSFTDATGKDLVKGISLENWKGVSEYDAVSGEVKSGTYSFSGSMKYYMNGLTQGYDFSVLPLSMQRASNDVCYLLNNNRTGIGAVTEEEVCITYELSLPYVFGDDKVHTVKTYWEMPSYNRGVANEYNEIDCYPKCVKVLFDEQEMTLDDTMLDGKYYKAEIKVGTYL